MDDNQLIRNWHTRAVDEDYFSKYVFEYLAFIGFLKRVKYTNENRDTGAISRLQEDRDYRRMYLEKIGTSETLGNAWKKIINELDARPLGQVEDNGWDAEPIRRWHCPHDLRTNHVCEEQGKILGLEDWENMVEFWHSIRNNLFHGSKNPQNERDQLLVENGYKTLHPLVEIFLTPLPVESQ